MLKKYFVFIIILLFTGISSYFQNFTQDSLVDREDSLKLLFDKMTKSKDDNQKLSINNQIINTFSNLLKFSISFDYPFGAIKNISILKSNDDLLKIYNWNIPYNDGTYEYFGFIQYKSKKKKTIFVYQLKDKSANMNSPETVVTDNEKWFGALYYQMIEKKDDNKIYYTLIGWDGNNLFTNKKVIDVLSFNNAGKPIFGAPLFRIEEGRVKRLIFEYAKQAQMSLHYDEKHKMIIMDHLSPSDPKFKGQFQYYGPDWSYDALEFDKGKWMYRPDIDIRNPKEKANKRKLKYSY
jgi:hypothetical protein